MPSLFNETTMLCTITIRDESGEHIHQNPSFPDAFELLTKPTLISSVIFTIYFPMAEEAFKLEASALYQYVFSSDSSEMWKERVMEALKDHEELRRKMAESQMRLINNGIEITKSPERIMVERSQ